MPFKNKSELQLVETVRTQHAWICLGILILMASSGCSTLSHLGVQIPSMATSTVTADTLIVSEAKLAVQRAETAEQQGKIDEAIRFYEQAQLDDPAFAEVTRRLAVLYDQQGHDTQARAAYERAQQQFPNDPDLMNDIGMFHHGREDWTTAESWFRRALEQDAGNARARNNLAMSLAMQGKLEESLTEFEQVVGRAAAHSNLGVLLSRQGRTLEAERQFQLALDQDPTIRPAREFMAQLRKSSDRQLARRPGESRIR